MRRYPKLLRIPNDYHRAFEDVFNHTSTKWARGTSSPPITNDSPTSPSPTSSSQNLKSLRLKYPTVDKERMKELAKAKQLLENEG